MNTKDAHNGLFTTAWQPVCLSLLLVVATLAVYWQVKDFEFISYDDPLYVTDNRHVQKGLTVETVVWAFTDATRMTNYWVPITWLSILLDYELYGLNAGGYHLTNVLLHILNILLLYFVLLRMTESIWKSAFVAALFALHPLHVESVAWVTERKDVLSTFFWLWTLLSYGGYVRCPGLWRYLLTLFLFILGLMAKPMLVTLPFAMLLLDYWPLGRMQAGNVSVNSSRLATIRKLIWEKTPFFVVTIFAGIATFLTQQAGGAVKTLATVPFDARMANMLVSYVSYIGKMLWPMRLSFLYPHPGALPVWQWAGALLILGIITWLVFKFAPVRPYLVVGWLWYLGTLFPVIGLVVIGPHVMADRYTYVPLIGLYLLIAWGAPEVVTRWRYKRQGLAITAAAALSLLAAMSWTQVRYWQNNILLYEHAIEVNADSLIAHNLLGNALEKIEKIDEAAAHYFEALRLNPENAMTYNNIGFISWRKGKTSEAVSHFLKALRIDPDLKEAHYNLGSLLAAQGDINGAVKHLLDALRIDPSYAEAHNNLGGALLKQGRPVDAAAYFQKAIQIAPDYAAAHYNFGMALVRQGKMVEATHHLHEAIRIKPDYTGAIKSLNWALMIKHKIDDAVVKMETAFGVDPLSSGYKENIRDLQKSKEALDKVIYQYQRGLSILPGFEPTELNLENYPKVFSVFRKYKELMKDKR